LQFNLHFYIMFTTQLQVSVTVLRKIREAGVIPARDRRCNCPRNSQNVIAPNTGVRRREKLSGHKPEDRPVKIRFKVSR